MVMRAVWSWITGMFVGLFPASERLYIDDPDWAGMYPHCDSEVLHAPRTCSYCDHYPQAQHDRLVKGIAFTNQNPVGLEPCPATKLRSRTDIEKWPGNRPHKEPQ